MGPSSAERRSQSTTAQRNQGAGERARDERERPAVEAHDPDDADHDGHDDVDERHGEEPLRSLLDAIQARARLVQQRDQQAAAGHEPEALVAFAEEERSRDRRRERGDERERRAGSRAHRDRRARDGEAGVPLALGGEAEQRIDEAELRDRRADRHERDDLADVRDLALAQVARVDRQQQQAGEAGDDGADAVDRRLAGQRPQTRSAAAAHGSSYSTWS